MSNRQDVLKMGNMLLEGWKMLSEGCPICATAIMSKNGNLRCPKCDLPIVLERNLEKDQQYFTSNQTDLTSINDVKLEEEESTTTYKSLEEAKKEYDQKNRRQHDEVSDLIGQYMMKGWMLLGAQCPSCLSTPLMCQKDGPKFCVKCNEYIQKPHATSDKPPSSTSTHETTLQAKFDMSQIPMLDPDMSGKLLKDKDKDKHVVNEDKFSVDNSFVEKWSHEISSKLLCGWVLLDEACERAASGCNGDLPLLRDLSGEKYCVKCGYQKDAPSIHNDSTKTAAFSDDDEDIDDESALKIQMMAVKSFASKVHEDEKKSKLPARVSSKHEQCGEVRIEGQDFADTLKYSIFAHIDEKLKASASLLDSEATSISESINIANLITALANARKAVKNM